MLEAVLRLRPAAAFADEVEPLQLVQARANVLVAGQHALEQRQAEAAAERGGGRQNLVSPRWEAIDPCEQHLLDGRRDLDLDLVIESPVAVFVHERTSVPGELHLASDQGVRGLGVPQFEGEDGAGSTTGEPEPAAAFVAACVHDEKQLECSGQRRRGGCVSLR